MLPVLFYVWYCATILAIRADEYQRHREYIDCLDATENIADCDYLEP